MKIWINISFFSLAYFPKDPTPPKTNISNPRIRDFQSFIFWGVLVWRWDAASHSGIQEKEVELVKGIPETLLQQLHEDWLLVGWWRLVLDIEATTQITPRK